MKAIFALLVFVLGLSAVEAGYKRPNLRLKATASEQSIETRRFYDRKQRFLQIQRRTTEPSPVRVFDEMAETLTRPIDRIRAHFLRIEIIRDPNRSIWQVPEMNVSFFHSLRDRLAALNLPLPRRARD
jgi:hypothetical protein